MRKARTFLVVADDPERLMLTSATLHRKFPNAVVQTCRDSEIAIELAQTHRFDAIVANRASDVDELPLVESLRAVTVAPIILMSGDHHKEVAAAAGAVRFLHYDQWLLVGTVVSEAIGAEGPA